MTADEILKQALTAPIRVAGSYGERLTLLRRLHKARERKRKALKGEACPYDQLVFRNRDGSVLIEMENLTVEVGTPYEIPLEDVKTDEELRAEADAALARFKEAKENPADIFDVSDITTDKRPLGDS